jgi:hypothetical protein
VDSKWQGWAAMAGVLMIVVGAFKAFSGFIGLFNDEWIVRGFNAYFFIDLTALAWWYLLIGLILVLAGLAAMQMKAWGRWVGVIAVGLAMISELMWLPVYPIWSILLITLYFFMIIGLVIARPSE